MSEEAVAKPAPTQESPEGDELWPERVQRQNDRDLFLLSLAVILVAFSLQVTSARDGITVFGVQLPEICGMKRMGWGECPGCGLTRSFVLGVRLKAEAFRLHPAGPILLLVVAGQIPYRGWRWWRQRTRRREGLVDLEHNRYEPAWRVFRWSLLGVILGGWLLKVWLRA
jgi:hypothetical protein